MFPDRRINGVVSSSGLHLSYKAAESLLCFMPTPNMDSELRQPLDPQTHSHLPYGNLSSRTIAQSMCLRRVALCFHSGDIVKLSRELPHGAPKWNMPILWPTKPCNTHLSLFSRYRYTYLGACDAHAQSWALSIVPLSVSIEGGPLFTLAGLFPLSLILAFFVIF